MRLSLIGPVPGLSSEETVVLFMFSLFVIIALVATVMWRLAGRSGPGARHSSPDSTWPGALGGNVDVTDDSLHHGGQHQGNHQQGTHHQGTHHGGFGGHSSGHDSGGWSGGGWGGDSGGGGFGGGGSDGGSSSC